ncbi:KpsF/GutQ family sugar-phosphate isomerase [Pelagibacteraceae bacterium]|nr:KpsF/GutQ family sugar-phosphate isomerase [Pelagibacteraceae bacterium]
MKNNKKIINSANRTLARELSSIKNLKSTFNLNFCRAINLIYNTKGKVVITGVGKSAHIGNKICATLTSTGTPSYFVHATEASHGDLGSIKKDDCVIAISNSGETSELNNIIEFTKRFNIKLISITSNSKSILHKNATVGILYKKPIEACPLNLAPTSSTSMSMIIGDCMAIALLELRGFKSNEFKRLHPGGNLGKDLKNLNDVMHLGKELPLAKINEKMSKALITMTKKSFGCIGVINQKKEIIGIITDGDLRRKLNSKFLEKKASEVMTKSPTLANKNMLVGEAINLMNTKKITSLFICDKKKPLGIVHIHDLLRLTS